MKLMIVFPGALYPITGMSQVRAVNQLKRLAQDYEIAFTDIVFKSDQEFECRKQLKDYVKVYSPVYSASYMKNKLIRVIHYLYLSMLHFLSNQSIEELTLTEASIRRQLFVKKQEIAFDAILIHYWYLGYMFEGLPAGVLKMIDTHYLVEENLELLPKYRQKYLAKHHVKRELLRSIKLQHKYFEISDLIIVNSARQASILKNLHPEYNISLTVNGQDLEELVNFQAEVDNNSILFYGALSNQFNRLALERLLEMIFPVLLKDTPALHLFIVGSNPPGSIISKFMSPNVTVTGFVDDVRPVIGSCCLMLLPLETGSGFRGRIVEVMALGVPVIGTSNALRNKDVRQKMSDECRKFALRNFSIEVTFGKLAGEISEVAEKRAVNVG
jgi:glycosyltransferase involved in cell wall biosynthesis